MSEKSQQIAAAQESTHGSLISYCIGFLLSIVLTLAAYFLVVNELLQGGLLVAGLAILAIVQLLVQLIFFLHLGRESGRRWNLMMFLSMLLIVIIVVAGSLWIMHNLDYHMMPAEEMEQHMMTERDKGF